jgi:acetyl-CoA C-acetyltransferase
MQRSFIVTGCRTPIGKFSGVLSSKTAMQLGGVAIQGLITESGLDPLSVDAVIMGHVLQAGQGQITARQAAVIGGIPMTAYATSINKVCLSGLQSIFLADLMVRAGEADVVIAGGMESMSNAPYLLPDARSGFRIGDQKVLDSLTFDGLTCPFNHCSMGAMTESYNAGRITRSRQDEFAARSHELAHAAATRGDFNEEIVKVAIEGRKGARTLVTSDEGVRSETTTKSLGKLRPAFIEGGTITAGNASQISDGAAVVLVMSEKRVRELEMTPIGELVSYGQVAGPDTNLLIQPSGAISAAAAKAGIDLSSIAVFEINEAFAPVPLAVADDLGIDESKVNVNGGAIALGHPIGMTGARLAITALYEMRRRGGGLAAVGICGGGGQGDAAILRSL